MSWFSTKASPSMDSCTSISKSNSPEVIPVPEGCQNTVSSVETRSAPSSPRPRVAASNCSGCYRRKIKCDRQLDGCSNCSKNLVKCTYPRQDPTIRQKRGPYNKDPAKSKAGFEQKLLQLEAKLLNLSEKLQNGKETTPRHSCKQSADFPYSPRRQSPRRGTCPSEIHANEHNEWFQGIEDSTRFSRGEEFSLDSPQWPEFTSNVDDNVPPLDNTTNGNQTGTPSCLSITSDFLLKSSARSTAFRQLHPAPNTISEYWKLYRERVDPVTKILHVPTFERKVLQNIGGLNDMSDGMQALMFSIYYAAVYSASNDDLWAFQCESKKTLLAKFGNACKQALSSVNILCSKDMAALQALTIFLISNYQDDFQLVYTLTGVAMRIAQSIGLCQDGQDLLLAPFEVEMRRRLWWNIYRLERRAIEDYGMQPFAVECRFNTHLPTNIDDADISPEDTSAPVPKIGRTEMTYCLVDIEIALLVISVKDEPLISKTADYRSPVVTKSLQDKQRMLRNCHQRLTSTQLQYCNSTNNIDFMTLTVANLGLTRVWLSINQPSPLHLQFALPHLYHGDKASHRLLLLTLETVEKVKDFQKDERLSKWAWSFSHSIQLHFASFLLTELRYRPGGQLGKRAWKAVDEILSESRSGDTAGEVEEPPSPLRDGLSRLFDQMMTNRQKELDSTEIPLQPWETSIERIGCQSPWAFDSDNEVPTNTFMMGQPQSPQKPLSPPDMPQFTSTENTARLVHGSGRLHSSFNALKSGFEATVGFHPVGHTSARNVSTWGFLTPQDSLDMPEGSLQICDGSDLSPLAYDEFMGVEWDDGLLCNMNLELDGLN